MRSTVKSKKKISSTVTQTQLHLVSQLSSFLRWPGDGLDMAYYVIKQNGWCAKMPFIIFVKLTTAFLFS